MFCIDHRTAFFFFCKGAVCPPRISLLPRVRCERAILPFLMKSTQVTSVGFQNLKYTFYFAIFAGNVKIIYLFIVDNGQVPKASDINIFLYKNKFR